MKSLKKKHLLLASLLAGAALTAQADITVGVTLSATGPAGSRGLPAKNTRASDKNSFSMCDLLHRQFHGGTGPFK